MDTNVSETTRTCRDKNLKTQNIPGRVDTPSRPESHANASCGRADVPKMSREILETSRRTPERSVSSRRYKTHLVGSRSSCGGSTHSERVGRELVHLSILEIERW